MKICLVNSFYPPYIGGAETYVASLAKGLAKRGNDVTVYCSDRPLKHGKEIVDGIEIIRMRTPATFYGTPLVLFPPEFFGKKYDVMHANFPSPYLAGISAWATRFRGTPAVLTWHNDLPPVTSAAGFAVKLHELVSWGYLGPFRKIITTTPIYQKKSKILRRYPGKVVVVPNGVDATRFNPSVDGRRIREKFGLSNDKVCLFVGALTTWHTYKGLDVLIRTFKMVEGGKLLIVGAGNLLPYYRSLVHDLDMDSRVLFAGRVDDESLPAYYAACDVAVLASKDSSEGFGLVLLEAMAAGKAVIGSRVGGIPWLVKNGENGLLVKPNDPAELAQAIRLLFSDDKMRKEMGKAGRKFAESNDWAAVAGKVESIYSSVK